MKARLKLRKFVLTGVLLLGLFIAYVAAALGVFLAVGLKSILSNETLFMPLDFSFCILALLFFVFKPPRNFILFILATLMGLNWAIESYYWELQHPIDLNHLMHFNESFFTFTFSCYFFISLILTLLILMAFALDFYDNRCVTILNMRLHRFNKKNPLIWAIMNGNLGLLKETSSSKLHFQYVKDTFWGRNLLHWAVLENKESIVELILQIEPKLQFEEDLNSYLPIHYVDFAKDKKVLKQLLSYGSPYYQSRSNFNHTSIVEQIIRCKDKKALDYCLKYSITKISRKSMVELQNYCQLNSFDDGIHLIQSYIIDSI